MKRLNSIWKMIIGAAVALLLLMPIASVQAAMFDLTLSNDDTGGIPDGTTYATVTVTEDMSGLITFSVATSSYWDDKGKSDPSHPNFGIVSFGLNLNIAGVEAGDVTVLPSNWDAAVSYGPPAGSSQDGFGKFDLVIAKGAQGDSQDPLVFAIDVVGDSIDDYLALSSGNNGGQFFAAHIIDFTDQCPVDAEDCDLTSVWVAGNAGSDPDFPQVPLPAAAWLFGSALLGLVTVARRRATVS